LAAIEFKIIGGMEEVDDAGQDRGLKMMFGADQIIEGGKDGG